jgi:hypothetical protein
MDGGLGNGDFRLPDNIKSGRYRLRAYTNYMRNFGDQLFFNKEITIINSKNEQEETLPVKYAENKIQLGFFPEGGSMIDNVSSIVAFKAVNILGKGCDVSGKIYSANGDLITTFRSTHLGMGTFYLRPMPGMHYYSIFRGADSIDTRTDLPVSFPAGVTISSAINRKNELIITTKTNPQTLELVSEHNLLLTISTRREVIKKINYKINLPVTTLALPADDLPEGILMLSLSASEDLPLAERLIYIHRDAPLIIRIETDKPLYNKRESVSVRISFPEDSLSAVNGNVSLAIADKKLTESLSAYPTTISSWFLLESDVGGYVEDPSYYFDPSNPERYRDLDFLLRTQGWRDFAWKYNSTAFTRENGYTISGQLHKTYSKKTIEDSRVSVGIFESNNSVVTTLPLDSSGRFVLSDVDITGEARIVVTGINNKDRLKGVIKIDSVNYSPPEITDSISLVLALPDNKLTELKSWYEVNEATRMKYKLSDTILLGEVDIISERRKDPQTIKIESSRSMYGIPDREIVITEQMQSYPYLIEVMRGRIPGMEVIGGYPNYRMRVRGAGTIQAYSYPLVLIDGNQASFQDLLTMPISFVERIDILQSIGSSMIFGFRGANGVINLITRVGGAAYVKVNYAANINFKGYDAARIFYSPQHLQETNSAFAPDLRSTLLWEPDINLEGNKEVILNYYNGDNSSVIKIVAEGITSTGIPVTGHAEYEIK